MALRRLLFSLAAIAFLAFTISDCGDDENELSATYRILNHQGESTDVIHYGDEMGFELIVTNSSGHEIKFKDERELYASAFLVYTHDGNYAGSAYLTDDLIPRPLTLKPSEKFHMRVEWERDPLPKGTYYSPLTIQLNNKTVINLKIDFEIQ